MTVSRQSVELVILVAESWLSCIGFHWLMPLQELSINTCN